MIEMNFSDDWTDLKKEIDMVKREFKAHLHAIGAYITIYAL